MPPSPSPKRRTVSIGGATFDLFVHTNSDLMHSCENGSEIRLPLGAKIQVKEVIESAGGGASNTAVGLKRLGCDAGFSGIIGSDQWGEFLLKNFKIEGVSLEGATVVEDETTSFSIIFSVESGERIILYESGTNRHLQDANFDRVLAGKSDWIYLNHIHDRTCIIQDDLIAILEKPDRPGFSWNPGSNQLKLGMQDPGNAALLQKTDLLFCNKQEATLLTGKDAIDECLSCLLNAGVRIPCITDGRRGSYAADGKDLYHCPILEDAPVIDTTGAGDAFGTGVTWAILTGLDLPNALRAGTINATSVVGAIGAQRGLLTDIEIGKRLQTTPLDVRVISSPR